ncbi:MAG: hypothetical protein V2A62_05090 [Candidatus Woesearchaeota archaeon]
MPELYLTEQQLRSMRRDLESIEDCLSSGSSFLDYGVERTNYTSPILVEREGLLPYRDYLEFLAIQLRGCVENGTVPEWTQQILRAYKCPHLPHALTPPVMRTAQVIPFPSRSSSVEMMH